MDSLSKEKKQLHKLREKYIRQLEYIHGCLLNHYSEDSLKSGAKISPDLSNWPDKNDLSLLFDKLRNC